MSDRHQRPGSRGGRLLRWAERLFLFGGAATLLWCAVFVADTILAQRNARRAFEAAATPVSASPAPAADLEGRAAPIEHPVNTAAAPPAGARLRSAPTPAGAAIATLSIPRVKLSAVVLYGSDARTLRRGPGHLENTPAPGERGNAVIAGHRDSFFRPLHAIRVGDDIFVATPGGRFHYRVSWVRIVGPRDVSVLEPTDEAALTLITCYPFWVLGPAPDRFIVRATFVQQPVEDAQQPSIAAVVDALEPSAIRPVVTSEPGRRRPAPPPDDVTLVRHTVEQFRQTYNARLVSHADKRRHGPLMFQTCDVAIDADQAGAACRAVSALAAGDPEVWTLTLRRTEGGWAIESIQSP